MTTMYGPDESSMSDSMEFLIDGSDVQRIKSLGPSNYGKLFLAKHQEFGLVAVRTLQTNDKHTPLGEVVKSLIAMAKSQHLLRICGIIQEADDLSIVSDYMKYGSLIHFQNKLDNCLPWPLKYRLIDEMATALSFLHENQIIHGSLKSDNILIDDNLHAKVSDYGMASVKSHVTRRDNNDNNNRSPPSTMMCLPPEYINDPNKELSRSYDIYSFGIILWELVTGKQCNPKTRDQTDEHPTHYACKGCRPDMGLVPDDCPSFLASIMEECWNEIPENRPSFQELQSRIHVEYQNHYEDIINEVVLEILQKLENSSAETEIVSMSGDFNKEVIDLQDSHGDSNITEVTSRSRTEELDGAASSRRRIHPDDPGRSLNGNTSKNSGTANRVHEEFTETAATRNDKPATMEYPTANGACATGGKPTPADLYKVLEGLLALDDSDRTSEPQNRRRIKSTGEYLIGAEMETIGVAAADDSPDRSTNSKDGQTVRFYDKKKTSKDKAAVRRFMSNDESKKNKKPLKKTSWFGNSRSLSRTQSAYTFQEGNAKNPDANDLKKFSWSNENISYRKRSSTSMPNLSSAMANNNSYEPELIYKFNNAVSSRYDLRNPRGLTVSSDGTVFICDPGNRKLQAFGLANNFTWRYPSDSPESDRRDIKKKQPFDPRDVTLSRDENNVLVTDFASDSFFEISVSTNNIVGQYRSEHLRGPWGIVQSQELLVFVACNKSHCILVFKDGAVVRVIGKPGSAPGQFKFPTLLAIDSNGNLFVADSRNFRVQILNPDGDVLDCIQDKQKFPSITGITIDKGNNLFVADDKLSYIWVYDTDGNLKARIKRCHGDKKFSRPQGVTSTRDGRIVVVDKMHVRVFNCWHLIPAKTDQ